MSNSPIKDIMAENQGLYTRGALTAPKELRTKIAGEISAVANRYIDKAVGEADGKTEVAQVYASIAQACATLALATLAVDKKPD